MKKLALSVIVGASLMVTSSAFGLEEMSDSNMKSATGQAGVTIALDDITLYQSIGQTVYRDMDGLDPDADGSDGDAAGIYISGAETLTTIRAIFADEKDRGGFLAADYDAIALANGMDGTNGTTVLTSKALTIDVARSAPIMTAGKKFNVDLEYAGWNDTSDTLNTMDAAGYAEIGAELADKAVEKTYNEYIIENKLDPTVVTFTNWKGGTTLPGTAPTGVTTMEDYVKWAAAAQKVPGFDATADWDAAAEAAAFTTVAGAMYTDFAVSGVVIGLPTIEIAKNGSIKTIGITTKGLSFNNDKSYITIKKTDSTLAILGGTLEIVAH